MTPARFPNQARVTHRIRRMAGATAIEYAILVALIGLLLIVGAGRIGRSLDGIFSSVQNCLGAATCTFGGGGGGNSGGGGGNSGGGR